jgi:hypothetical protein
MPERREAGETGHGKLPRRNWVMRRDGHEFADAGG